MNIEITKISVSKKGTVWIQAKAFSACEELKEGDKFECTKSDPKPGDPDYPKTYQEAVDKGIA